MADEVRLINAELLTINIAQIAKKCARSDAQKALIGRVLFMIEHMPTVEAEPVKHGRWIMREKDKLIPTGKFAVSEGHILHKTSADKPFNLQSANIIPIKEHKKVKIPYCPICDNYGDDEYDRTPFCPYCGTEMRMEGGEE